MHLARVSVIIPTLNEARLLPRCLEGLAGQDRLAEILIVDGGSQDGTVSTVKRFQEIFRAVAVPLRLLEDHPGRASQMNVGAAHATSEILLFLHADTLLSKTGITSAAGAIEEGNVGGGFTHRFLESDPRLRLISAYANLRSRLTRIYFGDQAIFARRDVFEQIGGYRSMAIMEDIEFTSRMRRIGRTSLRPEPIMTSARRFLTEGVVRTSMRMSWLRLAYRAGADPDALKERYREIR